MVENNTCWVEAIGGESLCSLVVIVAGMYYQIIIWIVFIVKNVQHQDGKWYEYYDEEGRDIDQIIAES